MCICSTHDIGQTSVDSHPLLLLGDPADVSASNVKAHILTRQWHPAPQMFKILGLLSLSTAYSLSVMYFEGVKLGDLQVHKNFLLGAFTARNQCPPRASCLACTMLLAGLDRKAPRLACQAGVSCAGV